MRTGGALVMIAAAMATAWAAANALNRMPPGTALGAGIDTEIKTAAIAPASGEIFRLSSIAANESCLIVKGDELSPGLARLQVNPACERLLPGVGKARFWRERGDGSVALSSGANSPVVEFAAGEGAEYESYSPGAVFLSLTRQ